MRNISLSSFLLHLDHTVFCFHNRIEKVQLPDMGSYRCAVYLENNQTLSEQGRIQLEGELDLAYICFVIKQKKADSASSSSGLPHFSTEPQHMSVVANVSLSLSCVAHGPPEPVRVIWLQDGAPLNKLDDPVSLSPSTLNLTGSV